MAVIFQKTRCFISKKSNNDSEEVVEDGICCPENYVDSNTYQSNYSDVVDVSIYSRFDDKLLDLNTCGRVDSTKRIVGGSSAGLQGKINFKLSYIHLNCLLSQNFHGWHF